MLAIHDELLRDASRAGSRRSVGVRLVRCVLSAFLIACNPTTDALRGKPATRVVVMSDTLRTIAGDTARRLLLLRAFTADGGPAALVQLRADVQRVGFMPLFAATNGDGVAMFPIVGGTLTGRTPIVVRFADPDLSGTVLARSAVVVTPAPLARFTPDTTVDSVGFAGETRRVVVAGLDRFDNRTDSTLVVTATSRDTGVVVTSTKLNVVTVTMRTAGATWVMLAVGGARDSVRFIVVPIDSAVALLPPDVTADIEGAGITAGIPWITADSASRRRPYRRVGNTWRSVALPDGRWRITTAGDGVIFGQAAERANELWLSDDGGITWRVDLVLADSIRTLHLAKGRPAIVVVPKPRLPSGSAGWYALRRLNGVWTPLPWPTDVSDTSWTLAPALAYAGSRLLLFAPIRGPRVGGYFTTFLTVASIRTYALRDTGWVFVDSLRQPAQVTRSMIAVADTVAARVRVQLVAGFAVLAMPPNWFLTTATSAVRVGETGQRVDPWAFAANNGTAESSAPDPQGRTISTLQDVLWTLGSDNTRRVRQIPAPWWAVASVRQFAQLDGDWCWVLVTPHFIDGDERQRLLRASCPTP